MADRTALTAGIAAASIAAVVAATPALITPNNQDLQVTAAAVAAKQVSTEVQLAAFTVAGFLSAFADGYYDPTYFAADIVSEGDARVARAEAANGNVDLTDVQIAAIRAATAADFEAAYTLYGEAGAIYYTLDNLLPAAFDYDDHLFAAGVGEDFSTGFYALAADLGVPVELVDFLLDPLTTVVNTALGPFGPLANAFFNKPIDTVLIVAGGDLGAAINDFINDPITELINTVGGDLGPLVNDFINDPISTVLYQGGPLGDLATAFINDPVGTTAAILGDDVYNFVVSPVQQLAHVIAGLIGQQQTVATLGLEIGSTEGVAETRTEARTLVNVDPPGIAVPTPKEKVERVAADAADATLVAEGQDGSEVDGDVEGETEAPAKPKPGDLVKNFNTELGKAATSISNGLKDLDTKAKADRAAAKADRAAAKADRAAAKAAKAEAKAAKKAAAAKDRAGTAKDKANNATSDASSDSGSTP